MNMYLINIFLILWEGITFIYINPSKLKRKLFCIIVTTQWILLSGLRHISIGDDTYTYKVNYFDKIINRSWKDILNNFYNVVFMGEPGHDPGYELVEKIVQLFSTNYQSFLFFIAIIFMIPLGIFVYKYSKDPCISFLIFSCLFYSFFAITGHRQTIVTGIVLLMGYDFIKKRKIIPFIVLILTLSTIHKSVLCVIPFYFIATKRITIKYAIFILGLFITIFLFKNNVMELLAFMMGYEEYAHQFEGAGTWTFSFIFLSVVIVAIWRRKSILLNKHEINIRVTYNATFFALLFLPLTYVNPNAMRVVQYFSLFLMLLIPEILSSFRKNEQRIIYYIAITLMILLLIKNNPQYLFFWEGL